MDGADDLVAATHLLRDRRGDRAGAQRVAEGLTGPKIRGERHGGQKLGQTERVGRHSATRTR